LSRQTVSLKVDTEGQSAGKDRDQLREMLNEELDRRGVKEAPSAVEALLDRIQASESPLGRAVFYAGGLKQLADYAVGIYKIFKHADTMQQPEWLEPPARASYRVFGDGRSWVGVDLDLGASAWLERILDDASVRMGNLASVEVWLAWDPEPRTSTSRLAVHIGPERVGVLDAAGEGLYEAEMESASHSDEVPFTNAVLHRRKSSPMYVLELTAPSKD
jgi:hypothetical protein